MIPDEAVEAAAWEMFQQVYPTTWATEFDDVEKPLQENYLSCAREVLKAALPYLASASKQPQRNAPTDWPDVPRLP